MRDGTQAATITTGTITTGIGNYGNYNESTITVQTPLGSGNEHYKVTAERLIITSKEGTAVQLFDDYDDDRFFR